MKESLADRLTRHCQTHLLQFERELNEASRTRLRSQLESVDFEMMARLYSQANDPPAVIDPALISPPSVLSLPRTDADRKYRAELEALGQEALNAGRVSAVLVAGGQGSRLGFEHPKGMYPIGPVTGMSLFQIHAEKILARGLAAKRSIPWYIMTSPTNDEETKAFFEAKRYFGLDPHQVRFFTQGTMPAVDIETGRLLLSAKDELFTSPNGHGGTLLAMRDQGVLDEMSTRGVDLVYYFQVDNPFIEVLDPVFLGHHLREQADISLKVIRKEHPKEKLGLAVLYEGKPFMIEYSDLPSELGEQTDDEGNLRYWAGSIAIHVFSRSFLERITSGEMGLPFHTARKKVPFVDESGSVMQPESPNAFKFETFIFDSLPMADRVAILETSREEEYEPLKNGDGEHSPEVVRQAITRRSAKWLRAAGISFPTNSKGEPAFPIEISPMGSLTSEEFARKFKDIKAVEAPSAFTRDGQVTKPAH